jgi:predicted ABC-type ATPase
MADRQRHACLERGIDFTFETVMSHQSKVEFITTAKRAGCFVQLIFVGIEDPAVNVIRVRQRVALGGHDVPEDRIVARWHRTMALLPAAIIASDRALLFDNSATIGSVGEVIAARPAAEWIAGTLTLVPSEQPQPSWLQQACDQVWRLSLSSPA